MTCVVGVVDQGSVWIGSDTGIFTGWDVTTMLGCEVFQKRDLLFGVVGNIRTTQVLHWGLKVPDHPTNIWNLEYITLLLMDEVRAVLKDRDQEMTDTTILLGYRGHLYTITNDLSVLASTFPYSAVGNGAEYALGSLYTTTVLDPEKRIIDALYTAAAFSAGVRPPFEVKKL